MSYSLKDSPLTETKIMTVLKLHAEGWKLAQICDTTELPYGTVNGLIKEPSNKPFIDDFRRGYMARVMEVPVANKRIRLDDLEEGRLRLLSELRLIPEGKITDACKIIRNLVEVLERAQNEMEQRPIVLAQIVSGYNEFGRLSDAELYEKRQELLSMATRSLTTDVKSSPVEPVEEGQIRE